MKKINKKLIVSTLVLTGSMNFDAQASQRHDQYQYQQGQQQSIQLYQRQNQQNSPNPYYSPNWQQPQPFYLPQFRYNNPNNQNFGNQNFGNQSFSTINNGGVMVTGGTVNGDINTGSVYNQYQNNQYQNNQYQNNQYQNNQYNQYQNNGTNNSINFSGNGNKVENMGHKITYNFGPNQNQNEDQRRQQEREKQFIDQWKGTCDKTKNFLNNNNIVTLNLLTGTYTLSGNITIASKVDNNNSGVPCLYITPNNVSGTRSIIGATLLLAQLIKNQFKQVALSLDQLCNPSTIQLPHDLSNLSRDLPKNICTNYITEKINGSLMGSLFDHICFIKCMTNTRSNEYVLDNSPDNISHMIRLLLYRNKMEISNTDSFVLFIDHLSDYVQCVIQKVNDKTQYLFVGNNGEKYEKLLHSIISKKSILASVLYRALKNANMSDDGVDNLMRYVGLSNELDAIYSSL